jgi:signal transduction histidine kinase
MTGLTIAWICMTHLMVFAIVLLSKGGGRKADRTLAAIMFCFGWVHVNHLLILEQTMITHPWTHWVSVACFPFIALLGPLFLRYTSLLTGDQVEWRRYAWAHLLPIAVPLVYVGSFLFRSEEEIIKYYLRAFETQPVDANIVLAVVTLQSWFYWGWCLRMLNRHDGRIRERPFYKELNLRWLYRVIMALLVLSVLVIPATIYLIRHDMSMLFVVYPALTTMVYLLLFFSSMRFPSEQEERDMMMELLRHRLARDFHDELGGDLSKLSVISQRLELLAKDDQEIARYVRSVRDTSAQLQGSIRTMVSAMAADNRTVSTVVADLREEFMRYMDGLDMAHDCTVEGLKEGSGTLPYESVRNIHAALREAMHNAVRHAEADRITLAVSIQNDRMSITITDNGKGMDSGEARVRGLHNMEQRITAIGGRFACVSAAGRGTELRFSDIPINTEVLQ